MAIFNYVQSGNHKHHVARTYHQDEPWKARHARAKLSMLDIVHQPLHSLERVICM